MICPHCTARLLEDARYCSQCGQQTALAAGGAQTLVVAPDVRGVAPRAQWAARRAGGAGAEAVDIPHTQRAGPNSLDLRAESDLHILLAQAHLCRLRGQWADAIEHCVAVLRAEPGNQTAHSLLGDIYSDQGKIDEAIQWLRMAIDLHPNPSDAVKLRQLERERARLASLVDRQSLRHGAGRRSLSGLLSADSSIPDGGVQGGTANLLGIAPQRWLRGITITSLAFAALMLIHLIHQMQPGRPKAAVPGKAISPVPLAIRSGVQPILPPAHPEIAPINRRTETPNNTGGTGGKVIGGSGFAADRLNSSTPMAAPRPTPRVPQQSPDSHSTPGLAPANIKAVRPLDRSGSSDPIASRVPTARRALSPGLSVPLEEGMQIAQVRKDIRQAEVLLTAPMPPDLHLTDAQRARIVRNVYRAARMVFAANTALERARITVQANGRSAEAGESSLLIAEIDHAVAVVSDAETEPVDRLVSRLSSLQWSAPAPAPPPQQASTSEAR